MNIDKKKLRVGLWYSGEAGNVIPYNGEVRPNGAVYAHSCFPLEIREEVYRIRDDGGYGEKDKVLTSCTHLSRESGRLAVAMVNSGDYDLYEALAVLAQCCERCCNVLWNKYLPEEDGYEEYSDEWKKANTICDFCRDEEKENDLICRAEAIKAIKSLKYNGDFISALNHLPAIDAVPVVRCRECKYWDTDWKPSGHPKDTHWCIMTDTFPCGDWFCADGERRDGGDDRATD